MRLDKYIASNGLADTRSQAENLIRLGRVKVNGKVITKTSYDIGESNKIVMSKEPVYVSRAALKLRSVAETLDRDFNGKTV